MLRCPVCKESLEKQGKSFRCKNNHTFDLSRQGYVNLSRKAKPSGDNKQMIAARTAFLETGAYDFLRDAVCQILKEKEPDVLIDLGCGQGYYTREMAKTSKESYGVDLSRDAAAYAAKHDPKTQYVAASIYDLPFFDQSADALISIFTPLPEKEAWRVLKDDGIFITVSPGKMHHYELKQALYETVRLNDAPEELEDFQLISEQEIQKKVFVQNPGSLLDMTPYRYKSPIEAVKRVEENHEGMDTTFDFIIRVWKKKPNSSQ